MNRHSLTALISFLALAILYAWANHKGNRS